MNKEKIQGIQMIGTQRSGSNLLRVMLDTIDQISAPHPPHILQRFIPLLPKYGDLNKPDHFQRLAADVCELVNCNPVPWEGVQLDVEQILSQCRQSTIYELFRVIYETAARQHGASYWLCKSMKNMFYAEGIESTGIRPYYIFCIVTAGMWPCRFRKRSLGKNIFILWPRPGRKIRKKPCAGRKNANLPVSIC